MKEIAGDASDIPTSGEVIGVDRYIAPRLKPESYPGEFPTEPNVLIVGDRLFPMSFDAEAHSFSVDTPEGQQSLDTELARLGVADMAQRYPVTVFGSNRCPGQLVDKFKPGKDEEPDPSLATIPMVTGLLKGYDVVYNAKAGNYGYFFADLYQGPETADTEIEVAVLFVTKGQLDRINDSEPGYDYTLIGEVEVGRHPGQEDSGIMTLPAFAHIGKTEAYAVESNGAKTPVALSAIKATNRHLQAASQAEFTDIFFEHDPHSLKDQAVSNTAGYPVTELLGNAYRQYMKMKRAGGVSDLATRKAFQQALIDATDASEKMVVDPETFQGRTKVDWDKHILPRMGEIAAIQFAAHKISAV